ncbi:MAG: hypothetical protein LQ346_006146 [Caloplaca aetnensis]|nr:MAG: hypothetical protein LQ346_006146 [Caloplaca aetnensis]
MQRNTPLRSEWEAEEYYNFREFHRPECKQKETKGKCGCEGQTQDQLTSERRLRKDLARQRKRKASDSTAASEEQQDSDTVATKVEEPGDEEFVIKAPPKAMPTKTTPAASSVNSIPHSSCFRCAFRNMKCDRQMPCGACVEGKAKCAYSPSTPTKGSPTTRTPTDGTPAKGSPTTSLQTKPTKGTPMNGSPSTSYFDMMDTATPTSVPSPSPPASWGQRGYATYSCMSCAARKQRCDRQTPCSACKAQKVDCVYNASTTPTKRAARVKATPRKSVKFAE